MRISIIVATSTNMTIGNNGKIPWHLPQDLKHFKDITLGHHILMGRKTFESIGKPLVNRTNLLVTKQQNYEASSVYVFHDLNSAIRFAKDNNEEELMVIGGEQIYKIALPMTEKIYHTLIPISIEGDTKFPAIGIDEWEEKSREEHLESNPPFIFRKLERR